MTLMIILVSVHSQARVLVSLLNLKDDANLGLYDASNKVLGMLTKRGRDDEHIQVNLAPGKYVESCFQPVDCRHNLYSENC